MTLLLVWAGLGLFYWLVHTTQTIIFTKPDALDLFIIFLFGIPLCLVAGPIFLVLNCRYL